MLLSSFSQQPFSFLVSLFLYPVSISLKLHSLILVNRFFLFCWKVIPFLMLLLIQRFFLFCCVNFVSGFFLLYLFCFKCIEEYICVWLMCIFIKSCWDFEILLSGFLPVKANKSNYFPLWVNVLLFWVFNRFVVYANCLGSSNGLLALMHIVPRQFFVQTCNHFEIRKLERDWFRLNVDDLAILLLWSFVAYSNLNAFCFPLELQGY